MKILVLHGPNLNLLGIRESDIYGQVCLADIDQSLRDVAAGLGVQIAETFQTNSEGQLVDKIQAARGKVDGIVINPAAYTHTSVAVRDALLAAGVPFAEVHISNTFAREPFRHHSYLSDIAAGTVVGFGPDSLFGDHVGLHHAFATQLSIGSAHAGVEYEEVEYVKGVENPGEVMPNVARWLVGHGYSDEEIAKAMGLNVLRVLEESWAR